MLGQKRIRDYGVEVGKLEPGENNSITDIEGIKVGHVTISKGKEVNTGVTALLPHMGDVFNNKLIAASHVINGFGKTLGTIQINELGLLETPIILTNTLSVGTAAQALTEYMLAQNSEIGDKTGTVNPVVCECNDQYLNDIRGCHVDKKDILKAITKASDNFAEGDVGAGRGMSCYGLKGGIGTASRLVSINQRTHKIGVMVLSNFGKCKDFILNGKQVGETIAEALKDDENNNKNISRNNDNEIEEKEKGSIIVILATDIPMTSHQLNRLCKRAIIGLNRTGSYMGNGSGELVIGFSTGNKIPHKNKEDFHSIKRLNTDMIDELFRAVGESTEEAIYNSMICADTVEGRKGNIRYSLKEYIGSII